MAATAVDDRKRIAARPDWAAELWDESERRAWSPPERTTASAWARKHRKLTKRQSPRAPGPWRDENQPILRGIMDLCSRRTIRELWITKAGQLGVSEAIRNEIGRRADQDPQPILFVLPDEKKGREIFRKRIGPLFEDTSRLRSLLSGRRIDFKLGAISLTNGTDVTLAWSGSPSSLASDPIGTVILDEVDKFTHLPGREADPVDLARVRLKTLESQQRSLLIAISTPTVEDGPISRGFEGCPDNAKLYYFVPCPHCGVEQRLVHDRMRWEPFRELHEASARAQAIKRQGAAWYECENHACGKKIDNEAREAAIPRGCWRTLDGSWKLYFNGREAGTFPDSDRIGVHAPDFYSLFRSIASCAAEFVAAEGRPDLLQSYYNSTAAEPFRLSAGGPIVSNVFARRCVPDPETGFVPAPEKKLQPWVSRLVMTVDTQKDHFYWVIRGYGPHGSTFRSHRVDHGRVVSFGDIEDIFYRAFYPYVDAQHPPLRAYKLGIDARGGTEDEKLDANRTEQVYRWCLIDPEFRIPLLGDKPFEARFLWRLREYKPADDKRPGFTVRSYRWDGVYFRDLLGSYIVGELPVVDRETGEVTGSTPQWLLNDRNDPDYNRHLSNVIKSRVRSGRGYVELYRPKQTGARHDYHDCEAMQVVMAHHLCGCLSLPTADMIAQMQHKSGPAIGGGIRRPDGRPWISKR